MNQLPLDVWRLLDLLEFVAQHHRDEDVREFITRTFPNISADVLRDLRRNLASNPGEPLEKSFLEKLGLHDALAVCLGESLPFVNVGRRPVAGTIDTSREPERVNLTAKGRAVLAHRRMVGGATDAGNCVPPSVDQLPFRPYKWFESETIEIEDMYYRQSARIIEGQVEEDALQASGGRNAVFASIRRHLPSFDPDQAVRENGAAWVQLKPILIRCHLSPIDGTTTLLDIKGILDATPVGAQQKEIGPMGDPKRVFVIHGRNFLARNATFDLLRTFGLEPLEWEQAVKLTGTGSPYPGDVLKAAFSSAQAVVVVLTGDDLAHLREVFQQENDPADEKEPTPQARPNVLFEAGMAFGSHPDRTIVIQIGKVRSFSDTLGRHIIHFTDSPESRTKLRDRLKTAGCAVIEGGTDWLNAGGFAEALQVTQLTQATNKSSSKKPR